MPETIKQFDEVLLSDGRRGAIVEVLGDQDVFEVDIGSSPKDWETVTVKRSQIVKIL